MGTDGGREASQGKRTTGEGGGRRGLLVWDQTARNGLGVE